MKTYNECPVLVQMFAAGLLEGTLTFQEINDFYTNIKSDHEESKIQIASLSQFYKKINNLIESKIKKENFFKELNQTYLNYWTQIALSKAQLEGVYRGYNFRANQKLNLTDFYFINADGQTSELLGYMDYKRNVNLAKETIQTQLSITKSKNIINVESLLKKTHSSNLKEFWIKSLRNSHCSVFLKPLIDSESKG